MPPELMRAMVPAADGTGKVLSLTVLKEMKTTELARGVTTAQANDMAKL